MLKYWVRVATLPKNRLAAHCYWTLYGQDNLKDPWFDSIRNIINVTGQCHIWNNQTTFFKADKKVIVKNQSYVLQTLQDIFVQFSAEKMNNENKLHLFKNSANPSSLSKYLSTTFGRDRRSALSNLRLGTTDLEIEKGRRLGLPRDKRFCRMCKNHSVEDEQHFLIDCPALTTDRKPFIDQINQKSTLFNNIDSLNKLKYLYFNEDLRSDLHNIATDMLVKLKTAREAKLGVS